MFFACRSCGTSFQMCNFIFLIRSLKCILHNVLLPPGLNIACGRNILQQWHSLWSSEPRLIVKSIKRLKYYRQTIPRSAFGPAIIAGLEFSPKKNEQLSFTTQDKFEYTSSVRFEDTSSVQFEGTSSINFALLQSQHISVLSLSIFQYISRSLNRLDANRLGTKPAPKWNVAS